MKASTVTLAPVSAAAPMPPAPRVSVLNLIVWGVLLAVLAASWRGADMRPLDLLRDAGNMAEYGAGFFPPDFAEWRHYLAELIVGTR